MVDYNNSENASSLIGMLKQGGGLVNIEEEQTITGLKKFKDKLWVEPSNVDNFGKMILSSKSIQGTPMSGWIRIGEYGTYGLNAIITLSTFYGTHYPNYIQVSIVDNYDSIVFNPLNLGNKHYESTLSQLRVKTDKSVNSPKPRYICVNLNGETMDFDILASSLNFSRYCDITWYDAPVIDTDIEGYTNYDLDLISST